MTRCCCVVGAVLAVLGISSIAWADDDDDQPDVDVALEPAPAPVPASVQIHDLFVSAGGENNPTRLHAATPVLTAEIYARLGASFRELGRASAGARPPHYHYDCAPGFLTNVLVSWSCHGGDMSGGYGTSRDYLIEGGQLRTATFDDAFAAP